MNAVIAMCTFCEMHGPRVIFTTQTYRTFETDENIDNDNDANSDPEEVEGNGGKDEDGSSAKRLRFYGPKEIMKPPRQTTARDANSRNECDGCESLGNVKYLSNEHESRTSFLSARQPLTEDLANLLKHACVRLALLQVYDPSTRRSLSCEVHLGKEGVCYFGDEHRGHVLSHAFTLKDAQARGIRRSCSFIVFMRDKQFLLNMWPFLVDNLRELIRELQQYAEIKYRADEAENPQRSARLATANAGPAANRDASRGSPRGLSEITNEKHVFVRIHMWLVWILSAGGRHFVEVFPSLELPLSIAKHESGRQVLRERDDVSMVYIDGGDGHSPVHSDKRPKRTTRFDFKTETRGSLCPEFAHLSAERTTALILRELSSHLNRQQFRQLLYASLTGIQVLVRGPMNERLEALCALSSLVPRACRRINVGTTEYTQSQLDSQSESMKTCNNATFVGVESTVAVPLPCSNVCRLEIISEEHRGSETGGCSHLVRWTGVLPAKLPTLLTKLEKSLDNEEMSESVLEAHFAALQEEWTNIAKVLHAMRARGHRSDLAGLMMSLGAGPHDQKLLDAWSMALPSNPA